MSPHLQTRGRRIGDAVRTRWRVAPAREPPNFNFTDDAHANNEDDRDDFLCQYRKLASPTRGFFGEQPEEPTDARLRAIVSLAEAESAASEQVIESTRDRIRAHFDALVPVVFLLPALEASPRRQLTCLFSALVHLRHLFHQRRDADDVPPEEPSSLRALCERLALLLGVRPRLNLANWILFNWRADGDGQEAEPRMRLRWFRGEAAAGRAEQQLWRAFALSELRAVPIYGAVGSLFRAIDAWDEAAATSCLRALATTLLRLTTAVKAELVDAGSGLQHEELWLLAHFQLPFVVLLDALLGVGDDLPSKTWWQREESHGELHDGVRALVKDVVLAKAATLRHAVEASSSPLLPETFNDAVRAFARWRSAHRPSSSEPSAAKTTLDHLIAATKARVVGRRGFRPNLAA
jgi:hypothetical protein